ncbi:MAG: UrcA family protein [Alphaproteobacteria bacterium]|nr:UrcA family protein [Alphaproteobacteria bacterium]
MKTPRNLIIASVAAAFLAAPAFAGSSDRIKQVAVDIAGYDLSDTQDATSVLSKIETAAEQACEVSSSERSLFRKIQQARCVSAAIDSAVGHINAPVLSELRAQNRLG